MVSTVLTSVVYPPVVPTQTFGWRNRPPTIPVAIGDPEPSLGPVALVCVHDGVLHSNVALDLRARGYRVIDATCVEEAVVRSAGTSPVAVFTDDLTVLSQARAFLSHSDNVRYCAIVSHEDPNAQLDAYLRGATEVLSNRIS